MNATSAAHQEIEFIEKNTGLLSEIGNMQMGLWAGCCPEADGYP